MKNLIITVIVLQLVLIGMVYYYHTNNLAPLTHAGMLQTTDSITAYPAEKNNSMEKAEAFLKSVANEKISGEKAQRYFEAFDKKYNDDKFSFSPIFFDEEVINVLYNKIKPENVSGFYIYPILYPEINAEKDPIPEGRLGKVSFLLAPANKEDKIIGE